MRKGNGDLENGNVAYFREQWTIVNGEWSIVNGETMPFKQRYSSNET